MKLTYHVLWFEDQFDEIQGFLEALGDFISEAGFKLEVEKRTSVTSEEIDSLAIQLNNYNPYDVIIFDYELGADSKNGIDIAGSLRNKIFTDMIFYSGKEAASLRQMLFEQEVDGVFIVARQSFIDDVEPIIEDHIKKISDINNIRGMVMSTMSSIDRTMRDLICSKHQNLKPEEREAIFLKAKNRVLKSFSDKKKKVENLNTFDDLLNNPHLIDFDKVRRSLGSLFQDGSDESSQLNNDSLLVKVQNERNGLAHQHDEYTEDGRLLLHPINGDPIEYNFEEFKRLRKELQKIKSFIEGCA